MWTVGSLVCIDMRHGHAPTADVAASFTPSHRVWMSPYSLALGSKEKVGIEFVGRDWIALRSLWWWSVSSFGNCESFWGN